MLQTKLKILRDALVGISSKVKVYHYWRPNLKAPFIIWAEDGEDGSLNTGNHKVQQGIHGVIDFYTKTEYDETFDAIQSVLDDLTDQGFSFRWDDTDYEDETNLIHHSWDWWCRNGLSDSGERP